MQSISRSTPNVHRVPFHRRDVARTSTSASASSSSTTSRSSPMKVAEEMSACYELVEKYGRGAVYLGSSRVDETHPHYVASRELARDVAREFGCTTWSGIGPGLMDAVTRGALDANAAVSGFMILLEAGGKRQESRIHPYLPAGSYLTTSFFSARKHGLVDAGVRVSARDRTAFFALPGGVGTLDEIFEVLALVQLRRIGTAHPVPFIVMNYDGCYDGLLEFLLRDSVEYGALRDGELDPHWIVCDTNADALAALRDFYDDDDDGTAPS